MNEVKLTVFPGELGWMAATWRGRRIHGVTFGHDCPRAAAHRLDEGTREPVKPDAGMRKLIRRLQTFAQGDPRDTFLDVSLAVAQMTDFQRAVVHHCRRIHAGKVITYGRLAARAGYDGAARAVGSVMSRNQFPLIVPCHRVVAANGRLGGYSAPRGLDLKRQLLAAEGVEVYEGAPDARVDVKSSSAD